MFAKALMQSEERISDLRIRIINLDDVVSAKNDKIRSLQKERREAEKKTKLELIKNEERIAQMCQSTHKLEEHFEAWLASAEEARSCLVQDLERTRDQKEYLGEQLSEAIQQRGRMQFRYLNLTQVQLEGFRRRLIHRLEGKPQLTAPSVTDPLQTSELWPQFQELESLLDRTLRGKSEEVESLKDTIQSLVREQGNLQEKLKTVLAEKESSEANMAALREQLKEAQGQKASLSSTLTISQNNLADVNRHLWKSLGKEFTLQSTLSTSEAQLADLQGELLMVKGERELLTSNLADSKANLALAASQISEQKERLAKMGKTLTVRAGELERLTYEVCQAEKAQVKLYLEIGGLNSELEQGKRQLAEQAKELSTSQQEIAELQDRVYSEVTNRSQVTEQLAEVQRDLENKRIFCETWHLELEKQLEMERAVDAEKVRRYQRRERSLERKLAKIEARKRNRVPAETQTVIGMVGFLDKEFQLDDLVCERDNYKLERDMLRAKYQELQDQNLAAQPKVTDNPQQTPHHLEPRHPGGCFLDLRRRAGGLRRYFILVGALAVLYGVLKGVMLPDSTESEASGSKIDENPLYDLQLA